MDGCRNRSQRSGLSHSERFARLGLTSSLPSIDDTILHDARRAPMTLDRAGEHVSDPRPTGIQRPCSPRAWSDAPSERGAGIGPTPRRGVWRGRDSLLVGDREQVALLDRELRVERRDALHLRDHLCSAGESSGASSCGHAGEAGGAARARRAPIRRAGWTEKLTSS